ncbi:hypothetical protein CUC08_Gglean012105 [Alternaria sp. MG1]|uniref:uncharacterized protein n=1 Tax=Alternaria postmessia TaxID=1187938 RepID=UPI000EDB35CC|nr:uncharacterized protein J4E82_010573 [Alternaria postmessia]KAI5368659.1 hypothetical protein J4E82_010573 [Alternaria postmessia]RII23283.1 hypothetical protein CUC08_Gglean012105 [Alternaria sp. MG1]
MTAPRSTQYASTIAAITASQNSAPVAEFRCLYTQDVKRKQKRWQDGYLKFHTFNSRVMVYDQARNFLGDTYHKDSNQVQEGDELTLNNGALVEVAEPMGITHTDLTQLLEKKTKEQPPPRPTVPSQPKPFQRPSSVAPANAQRSASQLRHKSLNTLLGTPKGPIGKAQPMKSPYEARKEKENEQIEESAPKRQKTVQPLSNRRESRPVQEESPIAKRDSAIPPRQPEAKNARKPAKFVPPTATVITIEPESDPHSAYLSDVTLPSTPPKLRRARAQSGVVHTPAPQPSISQQSSVQTPKIPKGKVPIPSAKALETPKQRAPPSSPPVSASNRLMNVDFAVQPIKEPSKDPTPTAQPSPPPNRKVKSLRLSTGVKRGKLLCQSLPQQTVRAGGEARATSFKARVRPTSRITSKEPSPAVSQNSNPPPQELVSEASRRISKDKRGRTDAEDSDDVALKRARVSKSPSLPSLSVLEDPEVIHGFMDQRLLVPSSPPQPQIMSSSPPENVPQSKPTITKKMKKISAESSLKPATARPKSPPSKETVRKAQSRNSTVEKPAPAHKVPSPPIPALDPPIPVSRDVSPVHTEASEARSRTPSTSPRKVPLSTGGIPKRPAKRTKKQPTSTTTIEEGSALPPRNEPVALPPHPLRANKKGLMMSTTELASLLQKPNNLAKVLADPIEDGSNITSAGKSPSRNFRRVRSENDAPIPSAADDWEKRNLAKTSSDATDLVDESTVTAVTEEPKKKKSSGLDALIKRTDPRRKFKRTQSLQVETNVSPPAGAEVELPSPVVDNDVGPWSTEAGDLFDWRPPGRG